jgi:hypothetical protein
MSGALLNDAFVQVGTIAQSCLATNLAYMALDRFRYRTIVKAKFEEAKRFVEKMPEHFKRDLAWKNIENVAEAATTGWTNPFGGWVYRYIFEKATDRAVCGLFALVALLIMALFAAGTLAGSDLSMLNVGCLWWFFILVAFGTIIPAAFIWLGRFALRVAVASIDNSITHLAERYREERKPEIPAA